MTSFVKYPVPIEPLTSDARVDFAYRNFFEALSQWKVPEVNKANLPPPAQHRAYIVAVPDEVGGYTLAFSDGTNWRRVQDRNVVS